MKNMIPSALNEEEIVNLYFEDIKAEGEVLTEEEERALAIRVQKGDKKAREILVNKNLRFVIKIAKEYRGVGAMPLSELISEGNIGLLTAVDKYQPEKGTRFVSYAIWWIRQSILKALGEKTRAIRLPQNRIMDLSRLKNESRSFEDEYGFLPSDEELARRTHLEVEVVKSLRLATMSHISIDAPLTSSEGNDSNKMFIKDILQSPNSDVVAAMEEKEEKNEILSYVNSLSKRESDVIKMRFGLDGWSEMSLADIGEVLSLTKERIRQIEKAALLKLRDIIKQKEGNAA